MDFSVEAEKDSWPRYADIPVSLFVKTMGMVYDTPDVIAISGWVKGVHSVSPKVEGGYWGYTDDSIITRNMSIFGRPVKCFSSSHERSHILCAYALSPFPQGHPCYALVWEGNIGAFYHIDKHLNISKLGDVLEDPGNKYAFIYSMADPNFPDTKGVLRLENAGKLMALVSFGDESQADAEDQRLIDDILARKSIILNLNKNELSQTRYYNVGVESQKFKNFARRFSKSLFERFLSFAKKNCKEKLPLIISGGCGLNCDWNSMWKDCGLFEDVFVPPCPNDSGSAIGTAADAMFYFTGKAKLKWSVYCGEKFVFDEANLSNFDVVDLDLGYVAELLAENRVLAWVQGRYEIGPRALGNRSIIASPLQKENHHRLNAIKKREGFRPIAPICLEEDIGLFFDPADPSPHMLYFQMIANNRIPAVTHIDGSARLQSVNATQNEITHMLLSEFKKLTGVGVLCNTSLNFNGKGFINRLSDLVRYTMENDLDGFVVNRRLYKKNNIHT